MSYVAIMCMLSTCPSTCDHYIHYLVWRNNFNVWYMGRNTNHSLMVVCPHGPHNNNPPPPSNAYMSCTSWCNCLISPFPCFFCWIIQMTTIPLNMVKACSFLHHKYPMMLPCPHGHEVISSLSIIVIHPITSNTQQWTLINC